MNKFIIVLISFIAVGLVFTGGYFVGKVTNEEVLKKVSVSYEGTDENSRRVIYEETYTDLENPSVIDNIIMIRLTSEEIVDPNIDMDSPDMFLQLKSKLNRSNVYGGLIDSQIWFVDDYAILGERVDENWEKVKFQKVEGYDVEYLKEIANYKQ